MLRWQEADPQQDKPRAAAEGVCQTEAEYHRKHFKAWNLAFLLEKEF